MIDHVKVQVAGIILGTDNHMCVFIPNNLRRKLQPVARPQRCTPDSGAKVVLFGRYLQLRSILCGSFKEILCL